MELREIAGELFVVSHTSRRETLLTPSSAKDAARAAIAEAEPELREYARQADELRVQIDEAALFDEPTAELRSQLAAITKAIDSARNTVAANRSRIIEIDAAVDRHRAERLQREHAEHLAAITAPFEAILKEIHA